MLFDPVPQLALEILFQHPTRQPASLSLHKSSNGDLTTLQGNYNYQKVWTQESQTQMLPRARQAMKMNEPGWCGAGKHIAKWNSPIQFNRASATPSCCCCHVRTQAQCGHTFGYFKKLEIPVYMGNLPVFKMLAINSLFYKTLSRPNKTQLFVDAAHGLPVHGQGQG